MAACVAPARHRRREDSTSPTLRGWWSCSQQAWHVDAEGTKHKHYYASESVGIACGLLLASLHLAGLAVLTHTPSPMVFLRDILDRPRNERPYLVLPVGYPAPDAVVPDLRRKALDDVLVRV
jgi:hypothetical protein